MKFKDRFREKHLVVKCGADMFLPFGLILGFYIIAFGTISPGGGFQGGVLVASAVLLLYLAYGFKVMAEAVKPEGLRKGEALGAIIYVLLGLMGIFAGANFCVNVIFDNGQVGDMISAGNITFMSYAVGFKVLTGIGFLLVLMLSLLAALDSKRSGGDEKEVVENAGNDAAVSDASGEVAK